MNDNMPRLERFTAPALITARISVSGNEYELTAKAVKKRPRWECTTAGRVRVVKDPDEIAWLNRLLDHR